MNDKKIKTLGELKKSGYKPVSIKEELRSNLIKSLSNGYKPFGGIHGYEDTVIPDLQNAILSRHDIIFLGLRGQAKTRLARMLVNLLDEYIPVVKGSEINDDPLNPISKYAKSVVKADGDDTEIEWVYSSERFAEKLATPDVTVADLIGDIDPIKAASEKLNYSDEDVIHFGLIPRSHRGIFVINELPDLQARIQVALFNILQEEDVQIRGFKMRMPLDIQFIFTANPEDYTNRGSIVTPLKDRIDSQILTHYPKNISTARKITAQEARITDSQLKNITCHSLICDLIEQVAFEARENEYVDTKSGVSARLTISAYENVMSAAERRMLLNNEKETYVRLSDLTAIIPSITGKIELVYEGEQEGPSKVAQILIGKAIRKQFEKYFPSPDKIKKQEGINPYSEVVRWFASGNKLDMSLMLKPKEYESLLESVPGLKKLITKYQSSLDNEEIYLFMELMLHGMAEYSLLSKFLLESGHQFSDMLSSMFTSGGDDDDIGDDYYREDDFM